MAADIATLDLHLRRRALIGTTVGMCLYALVVVALYPTFKNDSSLNQFGQDGSTVAALFGANGPLTTPTGWLNANLYANFVPLIVLLLTIGYGASCIAGQDEDGALGLIFTLPLSRRKILEQKVIALCVLSLPVTIVTALCVALGPNFQLSVNARGLVGVSIGVVLLGIDFGAVAMLVGALTGSRGTALGVSSALAAVSYLISSLAPVVSWLHSSRLVSPFYYAVGAGQLQHGLSITAASVLIILAAVLLIGAAVALDRLDLH